MGSYFFWALCMGRYLQVKIRGLFELMMSIRFAFFIFKQLKPTDACILLIVNKLIEDLADA